MKVSIIIAAYNVQEYIMRCINSCINQTYSNIEIVVVNDGSSDETANIVEKIGKEDKRVILINQKNKGLIEARKCGYSNSTGDYILFLDGDDWLDTNTVQVLYDKAIKGQYDVVGFKYILAYEDGSVKKNNMYSSFECLEGHDFLRLVMLSEIVPHIVNKFIRRGFLETNDVEFPKDISFAEDLALSVSIGIYKPKACVIDNYLYYYYQRDSAMTKTISPKLLEVSKVTEFIKNELINNNLLSEYKDEFEYLAYVHNYIYRVDTMYRSEEIGNQLIKIWSEMNIDIKNNRYYSKISFKNKIKAFMLEKNTVLRKIYLKIKK